MIRIGHLVKHGDLKNAALGWGFRPYSTNTSLLTLYIDKMGYTLLSRHYNLGCAAALLRDAGRTCQASARLVYSDVTSCHMHLASRMFTSWFSLAALVPRMHRCMHDSTGRSER